VATRLERLFHYFPDFRIVINDEDSRHTISIVGSVAAASSKFSVESHSRTDLP
jgi:hypothetical protein